MPNTYLSRSVSTSSNRQTWTWSGWVKKTDVTTGYNTLFSSYSDGNNYTRIVFWSSTSNQLTVSSKVAGNFPIDYRLTRLSRDTNGWMHIVVAMDTTQATDTNRLKIYINGVLETAYEGSASSLPPLNEYTFINRNRVHYIGQTGDSSGYFNGLMSHVHFCDGAALAPTVFGETDATTGEWKIKTSPTFTPGTNGFTILKDGNTITDQSSNSNNWSLGGGTLTKSEDSPSNVFCTWNFLTNMNANGTFSNGNNTVFFNNTTERHILATLGMNSGKFYWENKLVSHSGDSLAKVGIESSLHNDAGGYAVDSYGYRGEGGGSGDPSSGRKVNNGTFTNWGSSYTAGDIIGCAVDLDNNKIYFSKNGTWQESGDPTSGSTGTGSAFNLIAPVSGFYHPSIGKEASSTATWSMNFGNGYFGTTAVSSAGTNASGNGIFEYDVPTGYTALSTKGLNL